MPLALEARGLGRRRQGALAICLLWMAAALPSVTARSFIWEEGTNAEIARRVLDHGEFLVPYIYGSPWLEKPSLLPWLIAAVARLTGQVDEFSARLPSMLAALILALAVYRFGLRHLSLRAALFTALAFLFSPLVMQKLAIAEPDLVVTALSFAAFLLWWSGAEQGRVGLLRWFGAGLLLSVLVMAKGPQPAAFFVLGIGGWIFTRREWREVPGFGFCLLLPTAAILAWAVAVYRPGAEQGWYGYMRLRAFPALPDYAAMQLRFLLVSVVELLPAAMLAPFLPWRRLWPGRGETAPSAMQALAFYAFPCCAVLLFWPTSEARYLMPAAPALALLAGFAWDQPRGRLLDLARLLAAGTTGALVLFQLALVGVAMPLYADRFSATRSDGRAIDAMIAGAPAFCPGLPTNELFYFSSPIRCFDNREITGMTLPAWLVATEGELAQFRAARPGLKTTIRLRTKSGPGLMVVYVEP